ncbi:MAG: M20/M25/M40 family metallo-hydrolase [Rickettsiales bacterium]|jgi:acetylornithine deacetylase/succinyl-diaminopimelate desuccinylase-like protein|nr:M20/M25/M40 family metallo-hydrolase [Rickettsiales bacterium]
MLPLVAELVSTPSYGGNFPAMDRCFGLCREFLSQSSAIRLEEFEKNGHRSMIFSNSAGRSFDVLSLCHLDVVPARTYEMSRSGDRIFGRGVFDMKGFLAASLVNLLAVAESCRNLSYAVAVTSDEETGGENGAGYLVGEVGLETTLLLDSDNGEGLDSIVEENLGAITIELRGEGSALEQTMVNIRDRFAGYHCETYGLEMDINFAAVDALEVIEGCLQGDVGFRVLMLNNFARHDISNEYHRLYRQTAERNGIKVKYSRASGTNDARYFFGRGTSVISHRADGGGAHGEEEWLDVGSLFDFARIQREFLEALDELCPLPLL